jgi:L-fuconolactonase
MTHASRRRFLQQSAALTCSAALPPFAHALAATTLPVVDAHIHLFDPTRPGGVVWPTPTDTVLFRPALPARYRALVETEGVLAAIAVECSPLASDNDWLLQTAAGNDIIVAVVGDLDPAIKSFPSDLERLSANPLFRGIRYGNLWNRDLGQQLQNQYFIDNLRLLTRHQLVLESANPDTKLVADLLRLATIIPDLSIVIDHLPQAVPPEDSTQRSQYLTTLKSLSERPNIFVKGSEIPRKINGAVPRTLATYKPWLDTIWQLFGEDRIFFGSDWPNSDTLTPLADVFTLARSYLAGHSTTAAQKYFCSNSTKVYGWKPRNEAQNAMIRTLATW